MSALLTALLLSVSLGSPEATLDDFHDAAAQADGDRYVAHFTPDGVFVGTDPGEVWTVQAFKAYAAPHFSKGKGWTYVPDKTRRRIRVQGEVAWFYEPLTHARYGELRGSGVLLRRNGRWHIAQYVLSFSVPNDAASEVISRIKGKPSPE